jgi:hypothetical protein
MARLNEAMRAVAGFEVVLKGIWTWTMFSLLIAALLWVNGCSDQRSGDVAAIEQSYADFRGALLRQDYDTATNYVSSELLARYSNHHQVVTGYFRDFTAPDLVADSELSGDAWVQFDHKSPSKAFLFPHRPPNVGQGFVKETNGWKITVDVHPIVD